MAVDKISYSTISKVLAEIDDLCGRLQNTIDCGKSLEMELGPATDIVTHYTPAFSAYIEGYLKNPDVIPPDEITSYFKQISQCRDQQSISMEAVQLKETNEERIKFLNEALSKVSGQLKWFLMSPRKREDYIRLYQEALDFAHGDFGEAVFTLEEETDGIKNYSNEMGYKSFLEDKEYFKTKMLEAYPDVFQATNQISCFDSTLKKVESMLSLISNLEYKLNNKIEEIRRDADKLREREAEKQLEQISIDELNRSGSQIYGRTYRINTLKQNGYGNYAKIYKSSIYHLEDVYGISEDAAFEISDIVKRCYLSIVDSCKIKLNLDDKSPESTRLLEDIISYFDVKDAVKRKNDLMNVYGEKIEASIKTVSSFSNGLSWFFLSSDERWQIVDAYQHLVICLNGEFSQEVQSIASVSSENRGKAWHQHPWDEFEYDPIKFINVLEKLVPWMMATDDVQYGLPGAIFDKINGIELDTKGLKCTLRRYQELGVKYILSQRKTLLGDEMGLGKTIQAIASMVVLRNYGNSHFVVVCPAGVLANWCREIEKNSDLRAYRIHGINRERNLREWANSGGVAVATYESCEILSSFSHTAMVVVDEAHYIKNPNAQRTNRVLALMKKTEGVLLMTGTALENKVEEMITLIAYLAPEKRAYMENNSYMSSAQKFRESIASVYYRRKREDVLKELPELLEFRQWCELEKEEAEQYRNALITRNFSAIRRVSWANDDVSHSSKAKALLEIIDAAEQENRKVLVFSFFLDTISKVCSLLGEKCFGPINGAVPPLKRQEIIDSFDAAPAGAVLAAQIMAGGTGLNIQSASVVVICEPQLKPSIENQAISRSYRMGQSRNVLVYRLLCEDTIDERIVELLERKQAVFDAFADESEAARKQEIDEKSFSGLVQSEIERIQAS